MASEDHLQLSTIIKSVHKTLREETKRIGPDLAWEQHCLNQDRLYEYSDAMNTLASYWEENYKQQQQNCRVNWIYKTCSNYYLHDGILHQRNRETAISKANNFNTNLINNQSSEYQNNHKLDLLDVGSCYNPLKRFNCYNVTAIDLAPANKTVYKCDFTKLTITNNPHTNAPIQQNQITHLPAKAYDIIVFSLLLEYLPTPELRLQCCRNAYELLRNEGILIIITPDSKHVGANAKLMQSWRFVLAQLGFSRFKYEKLKYVHCMAFRKSVDANVAKRWAEIHKHSILYERIYIPQDAVKSNMKFDK